MTWQPYIHLISTLKPCHVPAGMVLGVTMRRLMVLPCDDLWCYHATTYGVTMRRLMVLPCDDLPLAFPDTESHGK